MAIIKGEIVSAYEFFHRTNPFLVEEINGGEIIAYSDGDQFFHPDHIEGKTETFVPLLRTDFLDGEILICDETGKRLL